MSDPLTPLKIEDGIRASINRLEKMVLQFATAGDEKALAKSEYKVEHAKARLSYRFNPPPGQKATDQTSDDHAAAETAELLQAFELADARYEAAKQALYSERSRLDALRSLNSNYREVSNA